MKHIDYKNRLIWDNIFIKCKNAFMLLNLYSFRREIISQDQLVKLLKCKEKFQLGETLSNDEKELYDSLVSKKQILDNALLFDYIAKREAEYENEIQKTSFNINRITISPTFACNFNCQYCYQKNFPDKHKCLTVEDIDSICMVIKQINMTDHYLEGITEVNINGGEPLQNQNINTINYITQTFAKPGIKYCLFTNGYNILRLKDSVDFSKFTHIQVSLDNIDPFTNEINGVNYPISSVVLEGLKYLLTLNCKITIATMFSKTLVENIESFIEQLSSINLLNNEKCKVEITPIVAFGQSTLDENHFSIPEYINYRNKLIALSLPNNLHVGNIAEIRWISKALLRNMSERIYGSPSMCSMLKKRSVHFAPDGKIYWCICVSPDNGVLGKYIPDISIDHTKINSIIRRSIFTIEKCKNCAFRFICSSGCPLHSVALDDDYSQPFCGFFDNPEFWSNLEELLKY